MAEGQGGPAFDFTQAKEGPPLRDTRFVPTQSMISAARRLSAREASCVLSYFNRSSP
jgi:hypothetical protein